LIDIRVDTEDSSFDLRTFFREADYIEINPIRRLPRNRMRIVASYSRIVSFTGIA